jgi:acyl transferase domain-containing protein
MAKNTTMHEPIAIVGSACRFAGGATSPSKLWELLNNPRDVRNNIPKSRFNAEAYYHPNSAYHGHSNIRHSYLLEEDVAAFDMEFFGIKPIEAKAIDPQQRILMETVYEGLESAGLTIDALRGGDTAVYVGVMCNDYQANLLRDCKYNQVIILNPPLPHNSDSADEGHVSLGIVHRRPTCLSD